MKDVIIEDVPIKKLELDFSTWYLTKIIKTNQVSQNMQIIKDIRFLCFRYTEVKYFSQRQVFKERTEWFLSQGTRAQLADYIKDTHPGGLIVIQAKSMDQFIKMTETFTQYINTNKGKPLEQEEGQKAAVELEVPNVGLIKIIL